MMSCRVPCDKGMTSQSKAGNAASNEKNVMWRRLFSYCYLHMIQEASCSDFSGRLIF